MQLQISKMPMPQSTGAAREEASHEDTVAQRTSAIAQTTIPGWRSGWIIKGHT